MVIRERQMSAFQQRAAGGYQRELADHLKEYAPELCGVIGDAGLDEVVATGVKRAEGYGFRSRGPLRLYLESMFTLGSDFDSDPQLPWAREALTATPESHEMARADNFYAKLSEYMEQVAGPNHEFAIAALRRIKDSLGTPPARSQRPFQEQALAELRRYYPQKCAYVTEGPLRTLIGSAVDSARSYKITSEAGVALLIGIKFGFGWGALSDPLYPWIGAALNDERTSEPNDRARRLYEKTKIYIDRMLQHLQ